MALGDVGVHQFTTNVELLAPLPGISWVSSVSTRLQVHARTQRYTTRNDIHRECGECNAMYVT